MKVLAIISQKGGAGRTTLAVNRAVAAEKEEVPTVTIDLDSQAIAETWHDLRDQDAPVVISAQASWLSEIIEIVPSNGAELVIIDAAAHSERSALSAARAADLVHILCRPAILDLKAIGSSGDLVALAKKEAVVVLNSVPHQGKLADEAEESVRSYGLSIVPVKFMQRAAYAQSLTAGRAAIEFEPEGKAAQEIRDLCKWACIRVHASTHESMRKSE